MKIQRHRALTLSALSAALVAVLVALGLGFSGQVALAAPGDPVVMVQVGGLRAANGSVAPVAGVVLGVKAATTGSNYAANYSTFDGATCTSDANGNCALSFPSPNRGVAYEVSIVKNAPGYNTINSLAVGPYQGLADTSYRAYITTGQSRLGVNSLPFGKASSNAKAVGSDNIWASSLDNPAIPATCGLRVGVLIDLSTSMSGSLGTLKTAANTFINALAGTPSEMAIFTFGTSSPASAPSSREPRANINDTSLTSLSGDGAATLRNRISNLGNPAGTELTNWDAGFRAVSNANFGLDVLMVLTDGAPTRYLTSNGAVTNNSAISGSYSTTAASLEAAAFSANQVKATGGTDSSGVRGTHIEAIGIGSELRTSQSNLLAISGAGDYTILNNYNELGTSLREFANKQCEQSVNVVKKTIANGAALSTAVPAAGFTFDATVTGAGQLTAPSAVSGATGAATFRLTGVPSAGSPVTIAERDKAGYVLKKQGTANATCATAAAPDVPLTVTNGAGTAFTVNAPKDAIVNCVVINEALPQDASFVVNKTWIVDGVTYAQGSQPLGSSTLTQNAAALAYGTTVGGKKENQTVALVDTNAAIPAGINCTIVSNTGAGTKTLAPGLNTYNLVTTITCVTNLSITHSVANGGKSASDWTVTATVPGGPVGLSGSATASGAVAGNTAYTLAARNSNGYSSAYIQDGASLGGLASGSTGTWECKTGSTTTTVKGSVSVAFGTSTACTAISRTAEVVLLKNVVKAPLTVASAANWTLSATPVGNGTLATIALPGAADAQSAPVSLLRPGTGYTLAEQAQSTFGAASRFHLTALTCVNAAGASVAVVDGVVTPVAGSKVTCTYTNTEAGLSIQKRGWKVGSLPPGALPTGIAEISSGSGAPLARGTTVTWTYEVKNTGMLPIALSSLVDDKLASLNCGTPIATTVLAAQRSLVCTGTGTIG